MSEVIITPIAACGLGWFWLIVYFINLRNKRFGDPYGGSEGSMIEPIAYSFIMGIFTVIGFVVLYCNFDLVWVTAALMVYLIVAFINFIMFWA